MIFIILYFITSLNCIDSSLLSKINRPYVQSSSIDIFSCFFTRTIYFEGDGGIIYCSNSAVNLNIKDSIYHLCICTSGGGGIYFSCNYVGTNCLLERVCVNKCFAAYYHFALIFVYNNINSINSGTLLSITNCANYSFGALSYYLINGNTTLTSFNSTKNFNSQVSCLRLDFPNQFLSIFTTFSLNNNSNATPIWFRGSGYTNLKNSNIIKNNGEASIIYVHEGIFNINNCSFINNQKTLFYLNTGQINVINCFLIHFDQIFSQGNGFFSSSNIQINSFTFNLIHLNTSYCEILLFENNYLKTNNLKKKLNISLIFLFWIY